jgi:hypothetical protein
MVSNIISSGITCNDKTAVTDDGDAPEAHLHAL